MTWLIWIWIVVILILTIGGSWDDYTENRSLPSICFSVAAGAVSIICVIAFSLDSFALIMGKSLVPLSLIAGLRLIKGAILDIRNLKSDQELSSLVNRIINVFGILFVGTVFGSAIIVGLFSGINFW